MKRMKNSIMAILLIMALLAGCGTGNTPEEKDMDNGDTTTKAAEKTTEAPAATEAEMEKMVELVFATNETPILTKEMWQTPVDKFMEANPNITIKNISQPSSNVMMRDYLKTLLATGEFPDIMVMASPKDFVSTGTLMAIEESDMPYIKDTSIGKIEGQNYLVPYKKMVGGMWYNKAMFAEHGLEVPETYDEMIAVLDKLKAEGIDPISMGLKDGWPQLVLGSLILSADILTEDPDWGLKRNKNETNFTSPEFIASMNKFADLTRNYSNEDMASVSYAQMLELFFSGKAAMIPMGSWILGEIERVNPDFEVGYFPIPSNTKTNAIGVWVNEGLAINANTEHPEEAKAFVEFFMTDKEWYGEFLKTEMLFSTTTTPADYEMSELRKEIGADMATYNEVENWYDMTGDAALLPGLQTYFNKMTVAIALGQDVEEELELFNQEWEIANDNLQ